VQPGPGVISRQEPPRNKRTSDLTSVLAAGAGPSPGRPPPSPARMVPGGAVQKVGGQYVLAVGLLRMLPLHNAAIRRAPPPPGRRLAGPAPGWPTPPPLPGPSQAGCCGEGGENTCPPLTTPVCSLCDTKLCSIPPLHVTDLPVISLTFIIIIRPPPCARACPKGGPTPGFPARRKPHPRKRCGWRAARLPACGGVELNPGPPRVPARYAPCSNHSAPPSFSWRWRRAGWSPSTRQLKARTEDQGGGGK